MQATVKTVEGAQHLDRDAQFRYINDRAAGFVAAGDPVVSVDCKKKELVGEDPGYKNGGRQRRRVGNPARAGRMTSRIRTCRRRSRTGCMTSGRMRGG